MMIFNNSERITAGLASIKAFPCTDFKTHDPIVNDSGESLYQFNIAIPGKYRLEQFPVKVFAKRDPLEGAEMGDSVELGGVRVEIGYLPGNKEEAGRGRQFWRIVAESVGIIKATA